ncbi:hypothetical protein B0H67DRAFT_559615 [Lasiosphaeris hirsuta]|uniref:DUF7704 domain-containing protein n=1 Tax=Lasiosphaeris hirsuta TaxID=260670 RepID=A0AA40B8S7_9PEZI|nr:hypothetical protein B0H67DRAFT_559615 [Lasiosphaeris hirsuta]
MASQLPSFPRFVFTVLEPISLLAGFFPAVLFPHWFISEQIATWGPPVASTDHAQLVARQLGNCYLLAFLVGVAVLYTTTEIKVVRNYLVALWLADISHVGLTLHGIGYDKSLAVGEWNAMTWGNVGATTFLFLTRSAYFAGLFGRDGPRHSSGEKKAQ